MSARKPFGAELRAALARSTPAFSPPPAITGRGFSAQLLTALRRDSRAFVDRVPAPPGEDLPEPPVEVVPEPPPPVETTRVRVRVPAAVEATTGRDMPEPEPPEALLRVIVADDDPLVRRLIRDALQRADVTVIAEASTGREVIELALFYRPDIVVMDFMMPEMDGIEATRRIHEHDQSVRVVLLTGVGNDELGLRALRAGASGYLSKEDELDDLPRSLRTVLAGGAAISPQLAMRLIERYRSAPAGDVGQRPARSRLTDREWEILDLLSTGASTDEIAKALVLPTDTVRAHLKRVYRKLEVDSREDAVKAVARLGGRQRIADS